MGTVGTLTRRTFLVGTAAVGGAALFGTYIVATPHENPLAADLPEGAVAFNPWVKIDAERITLLTPHADIGQGAEHVQSLLMAEELDLDLDQFETDTGIPSAAYYNRGFVAEGAEMFSHLVPLPPAVLRGALGPMMKMLGLQGTGGSTTVPDSWVKLRAAAASARETLKRAAAQEQGISVAELRTERGAVVLPDGTRLPYQKLAATAAQIRPSQNVPLRPPSAWRYIGKPTERRDVVAKSTGAPIYGIDQTVPGMVHAAVRTNPRRGPMLSYDARAAEGMPGVVGIVEVTNGVAVLATSTWRAFKAVEEITFDWDPAPYPAEQAEHWARAEASFTDARLQAEWLTRGDVGTAPGTEVTARYRAPYIAHQPLEPLNAIVTVTEGGVEVITGHQMPTNLQQVVAAITGHAPEAVRLRNLHSGGSFGHRLEFHHIALATEIANQRRGTPIKLTFTREEDFAQDFPRHLAVARARGTIAEGRITGIEMDVAGAPVVLSQTTRSGMPIGGPDYQIVAGVVSAPYGRLDHIKVRGYEVPDIAPTSSWRAVGASYGGFMIETFVDELAHAAGADPVAARLAMIDDPTSRAVLERCAEMANWQGPARGPGRFAGVALVHSFGVPVAQIVEIETTPRGIALRDVWVVADPGTVVDPINIENTIQGGVVWGLGHAINSELTYADGMAQQSNYHAAEGMRLYQCPKIHVGVLEGNPTIRGMGEPPICPAAPALGNAIFAATGQRLRETPFFHKVDFV